VRILLDTHLLLWALSQPTKLTAAVRKQIDASEVYASAASIWEISIKSALGKLTANPRDILAGIEPAGFSLLSISGEHAAKVVERARTLAEQSTIARRLQESLLPRHRAYDRMDVALRYEAFGRGAQVGGVAEAATFRLSPEEVGEIARSMEGHPA